MARSLLGPTSHAERLDKHGWESDQLIPRYGGRQSRGRDGFESFERCRTRMSRDTEASFLEPCKNWTSTDSVGAIFDDFFIYNVFKYINEYFKNHNLQLSMHNDRIKSFWMNI